MGSCAGVYADTFYDGESTSIEPVDQFGRQVALPPNSANVVSDAVAIFAGAGLGFGCGWKA